jgi:hypothetical protein
MNKKILIMLGTIVVPVGALLLSACGPTNQMDSELALDEATDNWVVYNGQISEYGRCNDAWDNDGDGLTDSYDQDCHLNAGPLRDLSLFNFPQGHNFFPDTSKIIPGGPGSLGGFRNRAQITRWLRFLTEPDGNTAGIDLLSPGVNPEVVPTPALLPAKVHQGTAAQGNNNNVSLRALHALYLEHGNGIIPPTAPMAMPANPYAAAAAEYIPPFYKTTAGFVGGWPGVFYKGGSQGALKPTDIGRGTDGVDRD